MSNVKSEKESRRLSNAKYRQTEAGRETSRKWAANYRIKFPEKRKAHHAISDAIVAGRLQRSVFCEECGLPAKTEGHHPDYTKPLEVDWLCPECHRSI